MRQVAAAAQKSHKSLREVEACRVARLLRDLKVVAVQHKAADGHIVVVGEGAEEVGEGNRLAL